MLAHFARLFRDPAAALTWIEPVELNRRVAGEAAPVVARVRAQR